LILPGGSAGNYKVNVIKSGVGRAVPANSTAIDFSYLIKITGVTPTTGSITGGTILTIAGVNFSPTNN